MELDPSSLQNLFFGDDEDFFDLPKRRGILRHNAPKEREEKEQDEPQSEEPMSELSPTGQTEQKLFQKSSKKKESEMDDKGEESLDSSESERVAIEKNEMGYIPLEKAIQIADVEQQLVKIYRAAEVDSAMVTDLSSRRCVRILERIVLQLWVTKSLGRDLKGFESLEVKAFRTQVSQVVLRLQNYILQLDEVDSNGNPEIRGMRRQIVHHISETILPKADALLIRALRLVHLEQKINECYEESLAEKERLQALEETLDESAEEAAEELAKESSMEDAQEEDVQEEEAEEESEEAEAEKEEREEEGMDEDRPSTPLSTPTIVRRTTPTIGDQSEDEQEAATYKLERKEKEVVLTVNFPKPIDAAADITASLVRQRGHDLLVLSDQWGRCEDVKFKLDSQGLDTESVHRLPFSPNKPHTIQLAVPKRISLQQRLLQARTGRPLHCQTRQPVRLTGMQQGHPHWHGGYPQEMDMGYPMFGRGGGGRRHPEEMFFGGGGWGGGGGRPMHYPHHRQQQQQHPFGWGW